MLLSVSIVVELSMLSARLSSGMSVWSRHSDSAAMRPSAPAWRIATIAPSERSVELVVGEAP